MFKTRWVVLPLAIIALCLSLLFAAQGRLQSSTGPYQDVPSRSDQAAVISRLKDLDIIDPCRSNRFCPDDPVDRQTLAVWLVRTIDGQTTPQTTNPKPRFTDVPTSHPHYNHIDRLAELQITNGCRLKPAKFCPTKGVKRQHLAAFLVRALDLDQPSQSYRFIDLDKTNHHYDNANRLKATGIDPGCGWASRFCPSQTVTRGQLAVMLAGSLDWLDGQANTQITGQSQSPTITVTHQDKSDGSQQATISWTAPSGSIDHYIVQSRTMLGEYGPRFWWRVPAKAGQSHYRHQVQYYNQHYHYAFRVITVYTDGRRLASPEAKPPSQANQLRDAIWDKVVKPHQADQPWLADTWAHINDPDWRFWLGISGARVSQASDQSYQNGLERFYAGNLNMNPGIIKNNHIAHVSTLVHELGHVYTLTTHIDTDTSHIGAGYLYLYLLYLEHGSTAYNPIKCSPHELYADLAMLAYYNLYDSFHPTRGLDLLEINPSLSYWSSCGLKIDQTTHNRLQREVPQIARSAFVDQNYPAWFTNRYQHQNGSINLDRLWADINSDPPAGLPQKILAGHFRHSFGGYCSETDVQQFLEGEVAGLTNPWKEGGCDYELTKVIKPKTRTHNYAPPSQPYQPGQFLDVGHLIGQGVYDSYTLTSIKIRNKLSNCLIAVGHYVFDVTPSKGYVYPGPGSLANICGTDASQHFLDHQLPMPGVDFVSGGLRP